MIKLNYFENELEIINKKYKNQLHFSNFLRLMADTGHLDIVKEEVFNFFINRELFIENMDDFVDPLISKFNNFFSFKRKFDEINNIYDLFYYCVGGGIVDENILDIFLVYFKLYDRDNTSHKDYMVINYFINKFMDANLISCDLAIDFIKFFSFSRRRNLRRIDYCVIKLSEYAINKNFAHFFKISDGYNHIQNILQRVYLTETLSESSKKILINVIQIKIKENNDFNIMLIKKIAICISGVYRGHETALQSIYDNLVRPLNANIYMHTWDQTALWPGIGGTPSFARLFGIENELKVPEEFRGVSRILRLRHKFPNLFKVLKDPIYEKTNKEVLSDILKTNNIYIENDHRFNNLISTNPEGFNGRGGLNQAKMFYGICKSFNMALKSTNSYDYIIRIRPDVLIHDVLDLEKINCLEKNVFYGAVERVVGITDLEFTISKCMAYSFVDMCKKMFQIGRLNPYTNLPKYDSHLLILCWLIDNGYHNSRDLISRSLLDSGHFRNFPNLNSAIVADEMDLSEHDLEKYNDLIVFFKNYNYSI